MVKEPSRSADGPQALKATHVESGQTNAQKKTAGPKPRRFRLVESFAEDQRSSCRTLCCDWLASASAEVAIDWRVDSAWLLAASSLASASVSADEPVCSTLIRFLLKFCRICTIDRLAPKAEACERSVMLAVLSDVSTLLVMKLSMKSVPPVRFARPRPAGLK